MRGPLIVGGSLWLGQGKGGAMSDCLASAPLVPIPRPRLIQHPHKGLELQGADVAHVSGEIGDLA